MQPTQHRAEQTDTSQNRPEQSRPEQSRPEQSRPEQSRPWRFAAGQSRAWPTRPWQSGDEILAAGAGVHMSTTSLSNRFLAGTGGRLPLPYLRHIAAGPRPTWDAEVAVGNGYLIGWAEFGRVPATSREADLAVIVTDPWQRRGIATELIRAMLPRIAAAGVVRLGADVLPSNRAAHGLLASLFGTRLKAEYRDGVVHYDVPLLDALADLSPEHDVPLLDALAKPASRHEPMEDRISATQVFARA